MSRQDRLLGAIADRYRQVGLAQAREPVKYMLLVGAGCVAPLFDSTQKFESGTGWPSFAAPRTGAVETMSSFLGGSELRCARCGGHLGDVFADGARFPGACGAHPLFQALSSGRVTWLSLSLCAPGTRAAETGQRYCIDGAALVFVPSEDGASPVVGDGLSARARKRS